MNKHKLAYFFIRTCTYPLGFLPFPALHFLGNRLGTLAYYTLTKFRKRALSNLSLAEGVCSDEKTLIDTAKKSFQNLMINCLEYAKFARIKKTPSILKCENPDEAKRLIDQGTGIIFYCGHQANWELLFLEGTSRMPGVAIGRPVKNSYLYNWVVSIREKFGGTIIPPKKAMKEGFRALKKGKFLGIVGDQGMPESEYAFDFFGRRAWTTPAPAILSYKSKCPLMVASIKREQGQYLIHYSYPIWPNLDAPMEEEIHRMMKEALGLLEEKIRDHPGQWLWQHNRWKQETPINVYYRFRWDSILVILPEDPTPLLPHLSTLREIYPQAFLTLFVPEAHAESVYLDNAEILAYSRLEDLFIRDYRFKLVLNFSGHPELKNHFLKLSAFEVLDEAGLKKCAEEHLNPNDDFSLLLKKALTRPNTLWEKDAC